MSFEGVAIPVTVSIGVATAFASDGIDGLLAEADAALYRAKNAGRNRVVYGPVSYTHLDVYKRQHRCNRGRPRAPFPFAMSPTACDHD